MYKNITVWFPIYYREHPEVVENLLHTCANIMVSVVVKVMCKQY